MTDVTAETETLEPRAEQEIDDALKTSAIQEKVKKRRKKIFNWSLRIAGLLLFVWLVYYLFKPFEGSLAYGICKTFLELNVRYPQDLQLREVIELNNSVRIWYSRLDPFGEYRMEQIQCHFITDDSGARIDRISVNRRNIDPAIVKSFNTTLPLLIENPPDLTLPSDFPDNIRDLQFQTDLFRKRIF